MRAPRAVSKARSQGKPRSSPQRGSSSLTHPCHSRAADRRSASHAMERRGGPGSSSHLDRPLAQTIRRGAFPGGKSAKGLASASFSPRLAFSPALELGGPTGTQRLAGTTELPRHGCWCPFFSGRELRLASRTVRRGEVHSFKPHLKATIILIFCQREGGCLCDACEVLFLHRVLVF